MMPATFESGGMPRLAQRRAEHVAAPPAPVDVELDDLDLAVGEHVGLPCRRHADRARDGVRGLLELGRDDEVDVELTLAPDLDVLDVVTRTTVFASGAIRRQKIDAIRLISSRDVHAMKSSASATPNSLSEVRLVPSPWRVTTS